MSPQASVATIIPAFTYLVAWYVVAAAIYYFLAIETNLRAIEESNRRPHWVCFAKSSEPSS